MTPTQRTLAYYRERDYLIGVVERWNPHVQKRYDLFGFIDMIAINDAETLGIQATSTSNVSARILKIFTLPEAGQWLSERASRRIVVIGWRKYAKPVNGRWWRPTLKDIDYTLWKEGQCPQ